MSKGIRTPYFNHTPKRSSGNQRLLENLLNQQVYLFGSDVYYILRESASEIDEIFGEDPSSIFEKAYPIAAYIVDAEDWRSGGDLFAKFGLQINKQTNIVITKRHFERWIGTTFRTRPMEGDLVYVPVLGNRLFEIKYVDEEREYYTHGKTDPYYYELRLEAFRYSQEDFDTGLEFLDNIERDNSYIIELYMEGGSNSYHVGEAVTQGFNTAIVKKWDSANSILHVYNIVGEFEDGETVVGASSGAAWNIADYDDMTDSSEYEYYQNEDFESFANTMIVTTEVNPFGTP